MGALFGTDGIRGVANDYPVTAEMALRTGKAIAHYFKRETKAPHIVIGKDTRASGDMLEAALVSGICAMGGDAFTAGVLPTPGIALLAREMSAEAAVVISASHNPYHDNGIKIFRGDGFKLGDDVEAEIEGLILGKGSLSEASGKSVSPGRVHPVWDASDRYVQFLQKIVASAFRLDGLHVVLDCANGATSPVARPVFEGLGAKVTTICFEPNGTNINDGCGSEHLERLAEVVVKANADVGFGFDGDGDRVLSVDERGEKVSGDRMLAIFAKAMKEKGRLVNNVAVSTVMSNIGLGVALRELGIRHVMAQVGDRYVLKEMLTQGARIGGEDSGHMIFLDYHTTGDGIVAALKICEIMKETGRPLSELAAIMEVFPQILVNVEVRKKPPLETLPGVMAAVEKVQKCLGERGRVLTRYSGTQPMCRVMVEGPTREVTEKYCRQIVDAVKKELG